MLVWSGKAQGAAGKYVISHPTFLVWLKGQNQASGNDRNLNRSFQALLSFIIPCAVFSKVLFCSPLLLQSYYMSQQAKGKGLATVSQSHAPTL